MSIENCFCLCDWPSTLQLWKSASSEEDFADTFFKSDDTVEIQFPDEIHCHLASWELLEDFSDWYRGRTFAASKDWDHFCAAWKELGLMEVEEFNFGPINELLNEEQAEVLFGALSPDSVKKVLGRLDNIDLEELDRFFVTHGMVITPTFSSLVKAIQKALDPTKGLVIFAG